MPDLISLPRTLLRGHPEPFEITGFLLEFIAHLRCGGRNDRNEHFQAFCEAIKIEAFRLLGQAWDPLGPFSFFTSKTRPKDSITA